MSDASLAGELRIIPLPRWPEVHEGDDLAELIVNSAPDGLQEHDVVVIAHKVVSKSEGRVVAADDRRTVAVRESTRVLRRGEEMIISETRHGFICANAGVDASNVAGGTVALLPLDPDLSARRIRARVNSLVNVNIGVIVTDTFGRAWRLGQTNVAIGVAGIEPFVDYRGTTDTYGRELVATRICVADEIAAAAELVMGKAKSICAAIVRGSRPRFGSGSAAEIVRPPNEDLFR